MRCEPGKRLKWAVREPAAVVTLIEADKLTNFDAASGQTTVIDAQKIPVLKLLNSNLSGWLTGDTALLEKSFAIQRPDSRSMVLTPTAPAAKAWLHRVEITLAADLKTVEKVQITEASGETIGITFHAVRLNPNWTEADWKLDFK